ncbi:type I-G CRISPR-associated protein Csb2 [Limisphaera sp. 4302-co]|uniref:type I-G CRISPR-associated protein Csb2 n=1 Tax=Limisphaera sp. 4302-co TaxID=3400417 RepID=UPI003C24F641
MTRYLCISVTLLDPLFHGKRDEDAPEWPPSPMRLFQALVAGSCTGCRHAEWSEAKANAYRWLERRKPPIIIAPPARLAAGYMLFVPNNDSDTAFERHERLTEKAVRPHRILSDGPATLHYLWDIAEDEWEQARPIAKVFEVEARHLTTLGWGIDQAVAQARILNRAEVRALPGQRWRPWDVPLSSGGKLRVPKSGSLDDLERAYKAFRHRLLMELPPGGREPRVFGTRVYLPADALPPRPYAGFELPEGVAFRAEDAAKVAAMLRSLACQSAKEDEAAHTFPGGAEVYVAGHVEHGTDVITARFSYLPLPSIGHEHADGMIRRLLVAEPFGGDGVHARWAQQRLRNGTLRDERGNERGVLLDLWRPSSRRVVELYVRESKCWHSVTPVVLPGFDDGKQKKAERLFLKALVQAGIPIEAVESFTLRKAPFWPGAAHPQHYLVPEYMRRFSRWHVAVRFREPIPGPLALGVGRHVGLGLFAVRADTARETSD